MRLQPRTFVALSGVYWAGMLTLGFLAFGAPCGLAPGAECDTQPPALFWQMLGRAGPLGVLLSALAIYFGAVWLNGRDKKAH